MNYLVTNCFRRRENTTPSIDLPIELVRHICTFLDTKSKGRLRTTQSLFNDLDKNKNEDFKLALDFVKYPIKIQKSFVYFGCDYKELYKNKPELRKENFQNSCIPNHYLKFIKLNPYLKRAVDENKYTIFEVQRFTKQEINSVINYYKKPNKPYFFLHGINSDNRSTRHVSKILFCCVLTMTCSSFILIYSGIDNVLKNKTSTPEGVGGIVQIMAGFYLISGFCILQHCFYSTGEINDYVLHGNRNLNCILPDRKPLFDDYSPPTMEDINRVEEIV